MKETEDPCISTSVPCVSLPRTSTSDATYVLAFKLDELINGHFRLVRVVEIRVEEKIGVTRYQP